MGPNYSDAKRSTDIVDNDTTTKCLNINKTYSCRSQESCPLRGN